MLLLSLIFLLYSDAFSLGRTIRELLLILLLGVNRSKLLYLLSIPRLTFEYGLSLVILNNILL